MPARQRIQSRPELVTNTLVEFNDTEVYLCEDIAKKRYDNNRANSIKQTSYKAGLGDPYRWDIMGCYGELAFLKAVNQYPYDFFSIKPRSVAKGTDNGDLELDGLIIDVKTTTYTTGRLVCKTIKAGDVVDLFCLAVIEDKNRVSLRGFCPAKLLLKDENYNTANGKFPRVCYNMEQKNLMSYDEAVKKL